MVNIDRTKGEERFRLPRFGLRQVYDVVRYVPIAVTRPHVVPQAAPVVLILRLDDIMSLTILRFQIMGSPFRPQSVVKLNGYSFRVDDQGNLLSSGLQS